MNILLLEDDRTGPTLVGRGLVELGHQVRIVSDTGSAYAEIERRPFDVALFDHALPGLDALPLLVALRHTGRTLPILLRMTSDCAEARAHGLDAGADDCVARSIAFVELAARIHALARRRGEHPANGMLQVQDIEMNLLRREVRRAGRPIALPPREFRILEQLLRHADRVVPKSVLLDRVWHFDFDPGTSVVETQVSRLRSKLDAGFDRPAIETVRGAGYMIRAGHDRVADQGAPP